MTQQPLRPGQQPGRPAVRVEVTADAVHPFRLLVGYHDVAELPMTAAALRSLRDALTAVLAADVPVADDFVAAWARAHGATLCEAEEAAAYGMAA